MTKCCRLCLWNWLSYKWIRSAVSSALVQVGLMAPPTNRPQKSSSDQKLLPLTSPPPADAGQRPLCSGDVQAAAGGLEEPGAHRPGGGSHPEGFAPGGAGHNQGQDVRCHAGTLVYFNVVSERLFK